MNNNKAKKWAIFGVVALLVAYVLQVIVFEARLGINQPENPSTIGIATFDEDNSRHERVVRLVEIDGNAYIAAQHWPRAWYHQALGNPEIEVKMEDVFEPYTAVPLEGAEEDRVRDIYRMGFQFRFRTGFPPRYFLRLDPR
jgi:hypothetical protein